jgi:DNA polymerase I-like protein with 3'-5' exonuclease and polymerase domains
MLVSDRVVSGFFNALYDRTVLVANGFELRREFNDPMLAHHSAFPGCSHGLQTVGAQFFALGPWKSQFRNADEDLDKLLHYNALDTGVTHALRPVIDIIVKKNKNELTYDIDRKMSECATRMHLRGMPVDREVNTELLTTFSKNVAESREAVEAVARDPSKREMIWHHLALEQAKIRRKADLADFEERYKTRLREISDKVNKEKWRFKISSGKHVVALLQALGVQFKQVTANGSVSTKKEILEGLVDIPIVRDLLTFRENDKLLSTFCWQMLDRYIDGQLIQTGFADENDRVHPSWSIHKISGRWASFEPVVSNVPKAKLKRMPDGTKKIVRPNLRRQIKARPGRKFVGFDFGQLEMRIIAQLSADPFLVDVFNNGKDIHRECARVVFPKFDALDKDEAKQLREITKPLEYASVYGANPETCWKGLLKEGFNIKLVDVTAAIQKIMNRMAGVITWQRKQIARASIPPYTISSMLLGRRRVWPMGQVEATEALNSGVQFSGSDIMNTGMARMEDRIIDRGYKECFGIVQVHDAAVYECWAEDAEDLAIDIKDCYEQEHVVNGVTMRYPVEIHIGDDWSQT